MTTTVTRAEVDVEQPSGARSVAHVAVLVSLNFPGMTSQIAELVRRFTRTALQTLVDLGASYELVDSSQPLGSFVDQIAADGLLVLGGGDVSAALSGLPADGGGPNSYGVDLRADVESIAAIRGIAQRSRPVLGICRGAQLINVAWGGSLLPDIEDSTLHRGQGGEPLFIDEKVTVLSGTRLARLFPSDRLTVRSGHHQAVDRVADGFTTAAVADDGIVEAIEHASEWIVGVQWHPEDEDGPHDDLRRLFAAFLEASSRSARREPSRPQALSGELNGGQHGND